MRLTPARIVLAYVGFAAAWILLSDQVVAAIPLSADARFAVNVGKGWAFVAVTGLLLLGLVGRLASEVARERDTALRARDEADRAAERLGLVIERSPISIVTMEVDGSVVSWNAASERMWGWTAAEAIGRVAPWVLGEERPAFISLLADLVRTGEPVTAVRVRHRRDGAPIHARISTTAFTAEGGRTRIIGMAEDVTTEVRSREALERALTRIRGLQALDDAILALADPVEVAGAALDHLGRLAPTDRASVTLFDVDAGELTLLATTWSGPPPIAEGPYPRTLPLAMADPLPSELAAARGTIRLRLDERTDLGAAFADARSVGIANLLVIPLRAPTGDLVGSLNLGARDERSLGVEVQETAEEVAARLSIALRQARTREELDRRDRRLRGLHDLDRAILGARTVDDIAEVAVRHLRSSLALDRVVMAILDPAGEALRMVADDRVMPGAPVGTTLPVAGSLSPELAADPRIRVYRDLRLAGPELPAAGLLVEAGFRSAGVVPLLDGGRAAGYLGLFSRAERRFEDDEIQAMTEVASQLTIAIRQARYRDDLVEREARIAAILAGSPNPIVVVAGDGLIVHANPAADAAFRAGSGGLLGTPVDELLPDESRGVHASRVDEYFGAADGQPEHRLNAEAQRRDGTRFPVAVLLGALESAEGPQAVVTLVDLSERETLERQLRQAQKMEAMGQFAGILAHDVRNYLTAIGWSADILAADLPAGDPRQVDVERMRATVREGTSLVENVLAFARPPVGQPARTDLAAHLATLGGIVDRLLGPGIALELAVPADLPPVALEPAAATQVLLNLATNARDAMPAGGTFRIAAARHDIPSRRPATQPGPTELPAGRYVRLTVADDGTGMDAETARLAFEPFFTTKAEAAGAEGTGLGLASVALVVARAGGRVAVDAEPGRGATFTIDLPIAP